ncbi:MAG: head-tail connector protein [Rickettsiales bacterium]
MTSNREYGLERVVAPTSEPINLTEAKLYLRVDSTLEDSLIGDLIVSARIRAEEWMRRSLITQTWKLTYAEYLDCSVYLPMCPVSSVNSVTIVNRDLSQSVVSASDYYINVANNRIIFDNNIIGFSIEIIYEAGYGVATDVPQPIKYGILADIAFMYNNREGAAGTIIPDNVATLYMPYREVLL